MANTLKRQHSLWLMCGVPASGKTVKAKELKAAWGDSCKYVSRDEVRFSMLNDSDEYFGKERDVWKKFVAEIQDGITNYDDTIADATHLNWASRGKLLKALHGIEFIDVNCYYFSTSLETCLERNRKREGRAKVPDDVIRDMYKSFTNPTFDPYHYHIIGEIVNGR